eukprot:153136-Pyramimonas_sp.AAC.1
MKHEWESTGRTPAPNLKKQRNADYELNASPLKEGFFRNATASGEWQPTIPAVVEDEEMVGQPATYAERIAQDEKDEELLNAPKPPESIFTRPRSNASSWGRPNIQRAGARPTSRSNSAVSMMGARWIPNPGCAPQAESRCPGKANRPEGA